MSGSASKLSTFSDTCDTLQFACRHCAHRKECPYSYDRLLENALRNTADQCRAAAQRLMKEAQQFHERVSCAGELCHLLNASKALERTLINEVNSEILWLSKITVLSK